MREMTVQKTTVLKARSGTVFLTAEVSQDLVVLVQNAGETGAQIIGADRVKEVIQLLQMMLTEAERLGKEPR